MRLKRSSKHNSIKKPLICLHILTLGITTSSLCIIVIASQTIPTYSLFTTTTSIPMSFSAASMICGNSSNLDSSTINSSVDDDLNLDSSTINSSVDDDLNLDSSTVNSSVDDDLNLDSSTVNSSVDNDLNLDSNTINSSVDDDLNLDSNTVNSSVDSDLNGCSTDDGASPGTRENSDYSLSARNTESGITVTDSVYNPPSRIEDSAAFNQN